MCCLRAQPCMSALKGRSVVLLSARLAEYRVAWKLAARSKTVRSRVWWIILYYFYWFSQTQTPSYYAITPPSSTRIHKQTYSYVLHTIAKPDCFCNLNWTRLPPMQQLRWLRTKKPLVYLDLTRFNKIAIRGTHQMAVDKEAICLSRVYSYYPKCNFPLFYV